jgi:K+-transporting ATPase ATPase B chain
MTPQEMKQLAELLQNVPGMKAIELQDVQGLAQLLRDSPEIGSIEVKGLFGTKVVITRTGSGAPTVVAAPAAVVLRRNLLVYGLGGLLAPFVGIKLIDLALNAVGLV